MISTSPPFTHCFYNAYRPTFLNHAMKAMILAAGRGERMRPLSDMTPKPMLSVAGKPLIRWQIDRLVAAGFTQIVINHAWLGDHIEHAFHSGEGFGCEILYSREEQALETAGGIVQALPLLGVGPFVVVSGDIYTDFNYLTLKPVMEEIAQGQADAHLVLVPNPTFHPQGDMGLENHLIQPDATPRYTYGNIAVFQPKLFAPLPRGEKKKLFPWLYDFARQGRVTGELFDGLWDNVGTPEQLNALDARLRKPTYIH
jgi:N-acetyl-alpha-D-muramate 1-phosphate uridylyltransferase